MYGMDLTHAIVNIPYFPSVSIRLPTPFCGPITFSVFSDVGTILSYVIPPCQPFCDWCTQYLKFQMCRLALKDHQLLP